MTTTCKTCPNVAEPDSDYCGNCRRSEDLHKSILKTKKPYAWYRDRAARRIYYLLDARTKLASEDVVIRREDPYFELEVMANKHGAPSPVRTIIPFDTGAGLAFFCKETRELVPESDQTILHSLKAFYALQALFRLTGILILRRHARTENEHRDHTCTHPYTHPYQQRTDRANATRAPRGRLLAHQ